MTTRAREAPDEPGSSIAGDPGGTPRAPDDHLPGGLGGRLASALSEGLAEAKARLARRAPGAGGEGLPDEPTSYDEALRRAFRAAAVAPSGLGQRPMPAGQALAAAQDDRPKTTPGAGAATADAVIPVVSDAVLLGSPGPVSPPEPTAAGSESGPSEPGAPDGGVAAPRSVPVMVASQAPVTPAVAGPSGAGLASGATRSPVGDPSRVAVPAGAIRRAAVPVGPGPAAPGPAAPEELLEVPDSVGIAADDFFGGLVRRVEQRP